MVLTHDWIKVAKQVAKLDIYIARHFAVSKKWVELHSRISDAYFWF